MGQIGSPDFLSHLNFDLPANITVEERKMSHSIKFASLFAPLIAVPGTNCAPVTASTPCKTGTGETGFQRYRRVSCALFVSLVLLTISPSRAVAQRYSVTDLGTFGGTVSLGTAVNSSGQVSGEANLLGDTAGHPFLWKKGTMTDLGTFGGPSGEASYLNSRGHLVGAVDTTDPDPYQADFCGNGTGRICHGAIWMNRKMIDVGTLGGNNSFATGINSLDQVVGHAELSSVDPNTDLLEGHAFLLDRGQKIDLGTLGGRNSVAINLNSRGQVIGFAEAALDKDPQLGFVPFRAALWDGGVIRDLGTLGGKRSLAFVINRNGQVAGSSTLAGDVEFHAFLWKDGDMQDLGTLPGDTGSFGNGLNNEGRLVGESDDATGACRAFVWEDGLMSDLNTLIPADSGWQLCVALDINDGGQITGGGFAPNGEFHGFLLTPCDGDHASAAGCQSDGDTTSISRAQTTERPKAVVPENVRKLLQRRFGFGRFGGGSKPSR
jgi:probable HAF family extracellular repeat protein